MKFWLDARLPRRLENTWKLPSRMCFAALVTPKIFLCWYINSNSSYLVMTSEWEIKTWMKWSCRKREKIYNIPTLVCLLLESGQNTWWQFILKVDNKIRIPFSGSISEEITSFNFLLSNFFAIAVDSIKSIRLPHTEINKRLTAFGWWIYIKVPLSQNSFQIFSIYKNGMNANNCHLRLMLVSSFDTFPAVYLKPYRTVECKQVMRW